MKRIRIASYKWQKTFFSRVIKLKQRIFWKLSMNYARYTHTEIVFMDDYDMMKNCECVRQFHHIWKEEEVFKEHWLSFSSSEKDGWSRFKFIEWKKDHWDFYEIELTDEQYKKVFSFCKSISGRKYNWRGIALAQWLNWNVKKEWSYFCSEAVTTALQVAHVSDRICFQSALFVSPGQLLYLLEDWDHIF